ncbi:MAG: hypothetical protein ORN98_08480 [Alphaproteobacteria bacterium]|nr:hypothetical protein [Alphaproteobacteria bacterium]
MKKAIISVVFLFIFGLAGGAQSKSITINGHTVEAEDPSEQTDIAKLKPKAMKGDYQAQRNLAYAYSTNDDLTQRNVMLACAWRMVILRSGSERIDASDVVNKDFYCGKLDEYSIKAANIQADNLVKKIYKNR